MNRAKEKNPIPGFPIQSKRKTLSKSNRSTSKALQSDVVDAATYQREASSPHTYEKLIQTVKRKPLSNFNRLVKEFEPTTYQFSK